MTAGDYFFDLDEIDDVLARDYLRVSRDRSGVLRSNHEQHDENGELCARKRWTLGESYTDEGSASAFQRKRRPDFDQLLDDLRRDRFGAHVLIIWEVSRGTRQAGEMETLLSLCQQRGVWLYVFNKRRLFNPHVVDDWEDLMHAAVAAAGEVMRTSQRTKRASKADAAVGSFGGGRRPFGYEANGVDINKTEAKVIKRCVKRVLAGASVRSLAGELNREGVLTTAGNAWHPGPLATILASGRIAGRRMHHGVDVGPAVWPAIIDEATHKRVVAVLATRKPTGRRGPTPWLLTGLLRCQRCGASLSSNTDHFGTRRYICRKAPGYLGCGGLGIKAEPVEEALGDLAMIRLSDVDARRAAAASDPGDADERADLDEIAAMRQEAAEAWGKGARNGGISPQSYREQIAVLDRRQAAVEASLAAKVREVMPLDFVAAEGYVGRPFKALDRDAQRTVLDALLVSVVVAPASVIGRNAYEPERITGGINWKV